MMRSRTFTKFVRTIALLGGALLLSVPAPATAQERVDASVVGGSGGTYFEYSCGAGRMLVGLHGSAGVIVDAVQAVCARVDAAGAVTEVAAQGPVFGGSRPFDKKADCPNQQAIRNFSISRSEQGPFVGSIRITCQEVARMESGGTSNLELAGSGHLQFYKSPMLSIASEDTGSFNDSKCPGTTYAIGIRGRQSEYLNALGLICAPKAASEPVTAVAGPFGNLIGQEVSFQASNYLDRFIRHRNSLGFTEPITDDLARADSAFRIVQGLAGKCISLESRNYPGQFLRHQAWRIKLAPREDNDLFKNDATFCMMPGLASSAGVSLESVNNPQYFIRHRGGELWLDRFDGSDLNRQDATFNVTNPGGAMMVR